MAKQKAKHVKLKRPTALCFSRGAALASAYEQVRSASERIHKGDLAAAEHYLFTARLELKQHGQNKMISPHTADRIIRAIEEPRLRIRKAMETQARGKIGRVSSTRIVRILGVIHEAQKRAYNQCAFGEVE